MNNYYCKFVTHVYYNISDIRYETLAGVTMNSAVFWDVALCSVIGVRWCFRGTYCLHLQEEICHACLAEAKHSSKILVNFGPSVRHIPDLEPFGGLQSQTIIDTKKKIRNTNLYIYMTRVELFYYTLNQVNSYMELFVLSYKLLDLRFSICWLHIIFPFSLAVHAQSQFSPYSMFLLQTALYKRTAASPFRFQHKSALW
jgi:hypothetical protein